ncbi:GNAT family N-acetyltransferase [bacterium]|nr:GNAT family N-acetyltransferase [bacterium]
MLTLKKVQSDEDIKIFAKLKLELIEYHKMYAQMAGITDFEIENYDYSSACKHINSRESYILQINTTDIGILQFDHQISDIDNANILYVHSLYICEKYRNKAFGIQVLKYLCNKYHTRIECSCWYDIPATQLYEKIGFKKMYTRYFLTTDNRFYDSDQN